MEELPSTSSPSSQNEIEDAALCEIVPSIANSRPSMDRSYDVFINHRGMDVKNTLASHIYYALESREIRVFLDKDRMETGELIDNQIKDAIGNASVYIAIFSKNYAGSPWCLNELCLMMEHPAKILPVFYDVEPCDLRWMDKDGPYAKALKAHQDKGRYKPQTLEEWKGALFNAAGRSGCELQKGFNGDEGALVKHIVNNVLKRVKRGSLHVAIHPVGLIEAAEDFEKRTLLRADDENVKVVGIVGMGGAGKTTLVKHLFNIKRLDYGRSSFLFDVRSKCLTDLQSKLLKDLTDLHEKFHDTSEGIAALRNRLSNSPALVVLDDMDHVDQLEALLVVKDGLRSGSLILVTSRDKGLLRGSQILSLYDMKRLGKWHAQQLFCWHAFLRPFPMEGFEELVETFLISCDGLPLSLKVFGALVCGNNIAYWKSQLEKISQKMVRDIKQRLRVSYDALDKDDREMFLDVACFFIGEEKDMVIRILDGCEGYGLAGLQTLENKCLIEFDDEDRIRMHDQLRDMGRDIADEESNKPRRPWRHEGDIDFQKRSRTTQVIRGICSTAAPLYYAWSHRHTSAAIRETPRFTWFDGCKEVLGICVEFFCRLKFETSGWLAAEDGLKFLVVEGDCFEGISRSASTGLVWFRWYNCPHRSLPLWLHSMEQLRVLELFGGDIQTPWHSSKGIPAQLRELKIIGCPVKFPKSIGQLKFLEKIVLIADHGTGGSMKALPHEFCRLQSLKHLELVRFRNLKWLPQNFGDLTNLQYLDLSESANLQALPDSFGDLRNLQRLELRSCTNLQALTDSFGGLRNLQHLELSSCRNLQALPDSFGGLRSLQHLELSSCRNLQALPDSFSRLRQLQYLCLRFCCTLRLQPDSLRNILALEHVDFNYCEGLEVLPIQITRQACLEKLYSEDTTLKELPNEIGELRNLKVLELASRCLTSLPTSIWNLSCLTRLQLRNCTNLKRLPQEDDVDPTSSRVRYLRGGIEHMRNLENLEVWNCPLSEVIPFTSVLRKVEEEEQEETMFPKLAWLGLQITEISRISISENVCPSLTCLYLEENIRLVEVEALPKALTRLHLSGCTVLKRITGLSHLARLLKLDISGCRELEELPNLEQLSSLQTFKATGCWALEELPDVSQLTSLKTLDVDACWNLKSIKGLEKLKRLEKLNISADDGSIWNDIRLLQRLPCCKLSMTCLTTRAVSGVESRVETILGSLASPLSIVEKPGGRRYGTFKVSDVESVNTMIACILFKAFALGDQFTMTSPIRPEFSNICYEVFGKEGKWISMMISTHDSAFFRSLKDDNVEQFVVQYYARVGW